MTSRRETDDPQDRSASVSDDAPPMLRKDGPVRGGDGHDQAPDAHLGAVDGETTPVIPPMHESTGENDGIEPTEEMTPG